MKTKNDIKEKLEILNPIGVIIVLCYSLYWFLKKKLTRKVDKFGLFYLLLTTAMVSTGLYNLDNIINCIETANYQVWVCNTTPSYFIFHISFIIWVLIVIMFLIDFFVFEVEEE